MKKKVNGISKGPQAEIRTLVACDVTNDVSVCCTQSVDFFPDLK